MVYGRELTDDGVSGEYTDGCLVARWTGFENSDLSLYHNVQFTTVIFLMEDDLSPFVLPETKIVDQCFQTLLSQISERRNVFEESNSL